MNASNERESTTRNKETSERRIACRTGIILDEDEDSAGIRVVQLVLDNQAIVTFSPDVARALAIELIEKAMLADMGNLHPVSETWEVIDSNRVSHTG